MLFYQTMIVFLNAIIVFFTNFKQKERENYIFYTKR